MDIYSPVIVGECANFFSAGLLFMNIRLLIFEEDFDSVDTETVPPRCSFPLAISKPLDLAKLVVLH